MKPDTDQYLTMFDVVMKYVGMFMASIYVAAGIMVLSRSRELFNIPQQYIVPLGIALTAYGIYRGFLIYQKYFRKRA